MMSDPATRRRAAAVGGCGGRRHAARAAAADAKRRRPVGLCKLNYIDPQLESDWFQTFIPLNIDPGFNMGLSTCDSTCATTTRNPKTFGTSGTSRCCGSVIRGFSSSPNYATWRSRLLLSTAIRARAKENAPKRRWSEFP